MAEGISSKTSLTEDELVDKIKGIIFGAAIGDGLGLATEFMHVDQARVLYGNGPIKFGNADGHPFWRDACRNGWFEGDFTDDTDQQLLILQGLLDDSGTLNPLNFAFRVKEWYRIGFPELDNKLPNGIGFTVGSVCKSASMLTNPLGAAYDVWNQKGRYFAANGAVMRTGIVGAPYFWDEEKVVENAMMGAKVTHADPRSVTSAVIVCAIISRLLRGSKEVSSVHSGKGGETLKAHLTDVIQYGSTDDTAYLEKFKNCQPILPKPLNTPIHRLLLQKVRRFAAYVTGRPFNPLFESDFSIPQHSRVDLQRFQEPAKLRENVKPVDDYETDDFMMKLCKQVVDDYSFLLENHSMCPEENGWVDELNSHCFPGSISELKLNERNSIGYTFKCLGSAVYLGTKKIPEDMTSAEFYQNLITQLALEAGDADTNCAVAGAILGCRIGKSGLPKEWVEGLRHYDFLERASNEICEMILKSLREN